MTSVFHAAVLKWDAPFDNVVVLDVPFTTVQNDFVVPISCSGDGSVLAGRYSDNQNNIDYAIRWAGGATTGTVIGTGVIPVIISNDGSTIYGEQLSPNLPCVWIGGSTTPTTLIPPATPGFIDATPFGAAISNDGSIIYGRAFNSLMSVWSILKWTNTVPSVVANTSARYVVCCSNDGSVAVTNDAGYYLGSTFYPLAPPSGGSTHSSDFCNGAGTVIYGTGFDSAGRGRQIQWTNISTVTSVVGGVSYYGNANLLDFQMAGQTNAVANAANVAIGYIASFESFFPAKWTDTAIANMNTTPTSQPFTTYGLAKGVSGDGTVACGEGSVGSVNDSAVYFDAMNVTHLLPLPFVWPAGTSQAFRVSRDGSTIYGFANWNTEIPTPPPSSSWEFRSGTTDAEAGVGQMWFTSSYVDFTDPAVLANFINPDGSWVSLGDFGELPTGTSPLNFLNVETDDPYNILYGWGQNGGQSGWSNETDGNDPLTGEPYTNLVFDLCIVAGNLELTDIQVQTIPGPAGDDQITLRWSDDAGASWSNGLLKSLGHTGEYYTTPTWYRLGMSRNRIIELSWSGAHAEALQGVFLEVTIAAT